MEWLIPIIAAAIVAAALYVATRKHRLSSGSGSGYGGGSSGSDTRPSTKPRT